MGNIHVVGPNEALIISGGWCRSTQKKMVIGNWAWAWWAVNDVQLLSLEVFPLKPKCENVETAQGVPICVTGVAQCKIMTQNEFLKLAAEQFLGMTIKQIRDVLLETLEGHLRAILGTLSVEEIYRDQDKFAHMVREVATTDVSRMGIEIVSFTIKDIYDSVEYLASLGRARIAEVKRDAHMGVSVAERDAGIWETQCQKESMDVKFESNAKMEDAKRGFYLKKAQFDCEVNTQQVETKLAYELESSKIEQVICNEKKKIELIEKTKLIELEEYDIEYKEKQLEANVRLPVNSEVYKMYIEALAEKNAKILLAEAEAEKIKKISEAEAFKNKMIGLAQADAMKERAKILLQYNEAAILSNIMETLPKMTKEIAKPLSRTSEIVITSSSEQNNLIDGINGLLTQLPSSIKALSGIDVNKYLSKKFNPSDIHYAIPNVAE